jgi:hypothetical protein
MQYKKLIFTAAVFTAGIATALYFFQKNDRFLTIEIKSDHPYEPAFETRPLSDAEFDEVDRALSQKYTYLACGGQAFVFFSEDGKYALKFFKQRHFRQPTYLNYIPFIDRYRKLKFSKRKKRINQEYGSYRLGFNELPHETALVYLHLNKTDLFKRSVTLIDRLKLQHQVDLDTTDFILQRRAYLVPDTINEQMRANDAESAKKTISSVVDLIVYRCKSGYGDKDPNIATNCGIYEGRAIKIDVGRFYHDSRMKHPLFYKPELFHLTRPFRKWLEVHHPELVPHLDKEVHKVIFYD